MPDKKETFDKSHDKTLVIKAKFDDLYEEFCYFRDKSDRDLFDLKASFNRIVDLKINNYDKIIDLEIFIIKLFIPVLSISFATGKIFLGIDTYILKIISISSILIDILLLITTYILRTRIITKQIDIHKNEVNSMREQATRKYDNLTNRLNNIQTDVKKSLGKVPHLHK